MQAFFGLVLGALVLCTASAAHATTVIPPTFAELIAQAGRVMVTEVIDAEPRRVMSPSGPIIVTEVTFRIVRTLKGEAQSTTTLEFIGGTLGEETLEVTGMPKFRIGDRDVLFVAGERQVSPLVGFMHGRFRITIDPATMTEYVAQYNFQPFTIQELGVSAQPARQAPRRAIPLSDFENQIVRAVRTRTPQP
jgi:hypothetical protein